jgi:hypothetical protein
MGLAGWEVGRPGVGEARLYAIQSLLQANIMALSAALAANPHTGALITNYGPLATSMVVVGDMEGRWDIKAGLLRIAVCAGDKRSGMDATGERIYVGGQSKQTRFTDVYIYFHDSVFNIQKQDDQRLERAIAIEVVGDWLLDGVLNTVANGTIPLTSRVYQDTGSGRTDELLMATCLTVQKGFFANGMGGSGSRIYYGIHATHQGVIQ